MFSRAIAIVLLVVLALGCEVEAPEPAGGRLLGVEVGSRPGQDHYDAILEVQTSGANTVPLTMAWSTLEPTAGQMNLAWLQMALDFYRSQGLVVMLSVPTIDTLSRLLPADLMHLPIDHPQVIARFETLVDQVLDVAGSETQFLILANEFDLYMQHHPLDAGNWQGLESFVAAGVARVRARRPDVLAGASISSSNIGTAPIDGIVLASDALFATYYYAQIDYVGPPTQHVGPQIDALVAAALGRPLVIKEVGYPTGSLTEGSAAGQAVFLHSLFQAWDRHRDQIPLVMISGRLDGDPAECQAEAWDYGWELATNPAFIEFICTTGLKTQSGQPKLGWQQLVHESQARGF